MTIRSFTIRGGRLPARHQRAWDRHAGAYVIEVPRDGGSTTVDAAYTLDVATAFGRTAPLVVEIGSGAGDALVHAAQQQPQVNFLAVEVWRPGVAQTLAKIVHHGVDNVRLVEADAAGALAAMLEPDSADEVWTFFPDPWPKTRHHKRRLVTPAFAADVARVLRPGGRWRLATDWAHYAWWIRNVVEDCPQLTNPYAGQSPSAGDPAGPRGGFAPRFSGRVVTRFERKGQGVDRVVHDLQVLRV